MRYVVTGGRGFIGGYIVDKLISDGHEVLVLDDSRSGNNHNSAATYIVCDISRYKEIHHFFKDIDGVFHTAAIARTKWCIDDPVLCHTVNVTGTFNVLESCRRHNVPRVVLSSSSIVYAAKTPYRASKEILEIYAETYREMYGVSSVCLRYSNVYGKRQSEDGNSPNVLAALRKTRNEEGIIRISGDGEQSRSYLHVTDAVEANILAMQSDYQGVLDITSSEVLTLNQIAPYFECPVVYTPEREGDVKIIKQDPSKAKEILGWEAKIPLSEGIKEIL
jgi:UDP-glucose 4-epimerase